MINKKIKELKMKQLARKRNENFQMRDSFFNIIFLKALRYVHVDLRIQIKLVRP